jgi:hypothetical protein
MFGGYVPEQHIDETPGNLVPSVIDEAVTSLTVSMFSEVLHRSGPRCLLTQAAWCSGGSDRIWARAGS